MNSNSSIVLKYYRDPPQSLNLSKLSFFWKEIIPKYFTTSLLPWIEHLASLSMQWFSRWNRKNRRTVRYICKSQFMFWLIITLVFLNTIIQVLFGVFFLDWEINVISFFSGDGASSPARVVGRIPRVHQPHLPLPLHPRDAHEDVRNVILGERTFVCTYVRHYVRHYVRR